MTQTTIQEARAMRALAMAGCQLAATEHGVTIVCPRREDLSQVAEDAVDTLTGMGWAQGPPGFPGTLLSSPGPLPDVVESRRAVQMLARSRYSDLRPVLDALWDLVVTTRTAGPARLLDPSAMRAAYRVRQLARRRRNRRG